jgi:hypothetical protein
MSGSTIGGVVGGVIGFFVGGPAGAQWGFMLGSAIGGYVDPTKIEGPRLTDAMQQTSQDGVPIPFGYGTFPTAGNVIWTDELKEHRKEERQGKGGPKVTSYTYTRSYAVGICEGPITGLLMIKRNGKVVWDARDAQTFSDYLQGALENSTSVWRSFGALFLAKGAWNARWAGKASFYLGDEEQLPDSTIEAVVGVGKAPAHRGLAYIVVKDDDVTDLQGAIPQYEFVVAVAGVAGAVELSEPAVSYVQPLGSNVQDICYSIGTNPTDLRTRTGNFVAVTVDSEVFVSADGTSWTQVADNQGYSYRSCSGSPDGVVVVSHGSSNVIVSHDEGLSWVSYGTANSSAYLQTMWSKGNFIRVGFGSSAEYSVDNGQSWISSPRPTGKTARHGVVMHGHGALALCEGGAIHVTKDGGATWSAASMVDDPDPNANFTGGAFDGTTVRAYKLVHSTLYVYSSIDLGASFTAQAFVVADLMREYVGGKIVHDGTRWIGTGPATDTSTYPRIYTSLTGLPPFAELEVQGGVSASSSQSLLYGIALGYGVAATVGGQSGGAGFAYRMNLGCTGVEIPDSPGTFVHEDGSICIETGEAISLGTTRLATVVGDLCARAGLTDGDYDVSQLTDSVLGYKVATESGADAMIGALMPAYFFDAVEYDAKLRFVKRGGEAVVSLGPDDYVERDGEAVTFERVQEAELLRKVTVGYIDPITAYATSTQSWERRSGTIQAKGESASELPIVCSADFAAQVAEKRGKVAWAEPEKLLFSLPALRWARLVPTTVAHALVRGQVVRVRVGSVEEDSGVLLVEASRDRQAAYVGTVSGALPPPPLIVEPPLIGPTKLAVMDLPVWREADDRLGVYVAACGYLAGWRGAEVEFSADGGATYTAAVEAVAAANIGVTRTALPAWESAEYPTAQTVTVLLPRAPVSVSETALLGYANRAALKLNDGTWEILQFRTATANEDGSHTLSGLIRGRYATVPGIAGAGATFVLLDDAVQFVDLPRHLVSLPLLARAVSYGTDPDAISGSELTIVGRSQIEWPVHSLAATRDDSDTVVVSWVGRGRIGAEIVAHHSTQFAGYRVSFSDGHTADVTETAYTRASTPAGVTVSVAALNTITGAGPSESIST